MQQFYFLIFDLLNEEFKNSKEICFTEPVIILFVSIYLYSDAFPKWKSNAFMGFVDLFTLIHIAHLELYITKDCT